jgi:hypothetical protein
MIELTRVKFWEQRLFQYTASIIDKPFEWGTHDCVIFAASCVEAQTGQDLAAEHRGTYEGPTGAARIIREAGCESLGDFLALYLPEKPVPFLQRGDVALCEDAEGNQFTAICQGRTCVGPTPGGLIHVKTSQAIRAYKV